MIPNEHEQYILYIHRYKASKILTSQLILRRLKTSRIIIAAYRMLCRVDSGDIFTGNYCFTLLYRCEATQNNTKTSLTWVNEAVGDSLQVSILLPLSILSKSGAMHCALCSVYTEQYTPVKLNFNLCTLIQLVSSDLKPLGAFTRVILAIDDLDTRLVCCCMIILIRILLSRYVPNLSNCPVLLKILINYMPYAIKLAKFFYRV